MPAFFNFQIRNVLRKTVYYKTRLYTLHGSLLEVIDLLQQTLTKDRFCFSELMKQPGIYCIDRGRLNWAVKWIME